MEDRDPISVLAGTGLKVYLYLLTKDDYTGVREVQRALGFKSPSTARHHLERLTELGLAVKSSRGYRALPPKGVLREVVIVKGRLLPRNLFLAGFLAGALTVYSLLPGRDPAAIIILLISTIIQLYNTARFYQSLRRLLGK